MHHQNDVNSEHDIAGKCKAHILQTITAAVCDTTSKSYMALNRQSLTSKTPHQTNLTSG